MEYDKKRTCTYCKYWNFDIASPLNANMTAYNPLSVGQCSSGIVKDCLWNTVFDEKPLTRGYFGCNAFEKRDENE